MCSSPTFEVFTSLSYTDNRQTLEIVVIPKFSFRYLTLFFTSRIVSFVQFSSYKSLPTSMRFGMVGTSGLWTKLILAFAPNQLSHFSRKMRPSGPTPLIHFWLNQQPPVSSFSLNRKKIWWAQVDSNHRPHAYQACALTTWAMRPLDFSGYLPFSSSFSGTWKLNNISHTHKRWPEFWVLRVALGTP